MNKYVIYVNLLFFTSCNIFDKKEVLLDRHEINNEYSISAYYVGVGATTNDVVQIRKEKIDGSVSIIKVFENYNYVNFINVNKDTLKVILNDTSGWITNKADTIIFELSKL